jgi:hypothetical protein
VSVTGGECDTQRMTIYEASPKAPTRIRARHLEEHRAQLVVVKQVVLHARLLTERLQQGFQAERQSLLMLRISCSIEIGTALKCHRESESVRWLCTFTHSHVVVEPCQLRGRGRG